MTVMTLIDHHSAIHNFFNSAKRLVDLYENNAWRTMKFIGYFVSMTTALSAVSCQSFENEDISNN